MRKKIKILLSNEFVQGGFFLTFSSILVNLLNYFFHFLAGRSLGPSGYGEIITLFSYLYLTSVPISVISTVITQKISSRPKNQFQFIIALEDFFWKKLKKWWFLFILLIGMTPFVPRTTNLTLITSLTLILMIVLSLPGTFYNAAFLGLKLFFWAASIGVAATIIKLTGPILTTLGLDGQATVMVFLLASNLLALLASKIFLDHQINKHQSASRRTTNLVINKRLLHLIFDKQVLITTVSLLSITALNNLDVIYVKKFLPSLEAGLYGSWSLFARIILFVVSPILPVSFVFFAGKAKRIKQNQVFFLLLLGSLFIGVISYIGYTFLAHPLVNLLFGSKFNQVAPYLSLASIFGSLYTIIFFVNNYFLAKKSSFSLILPLFIPLYVLFLFFIPKELFSLMKLNIVFSLIVAIFYLLAYNFSQWNSSKKIIS